MNAGNQLSTHQITVVASYPPNGSHVQEGYKYVGTMASDQAQRFLSHQSYKNPWGMVFNVDPIRLPGSHWLAMYYNGDHIEVFDSYGSQQFFHRYPKLAFLKQNKNVRLKKSPRLQSDDTYVCGHYCLSFLWHRTRNISQYTFVGSFPGPPKTNDKIVCQFVCQEMIPSQIQTQFKNQYVGPLSHPCQGCCCKKDL